MGVCWLAEYKAYAFPERDGHGEVCGMVLGFEDGRMASFEGVRRGLSLPIGWRERPGPLYICDGLLDTAAATKMGYRAIGRPPIGDVIADLVTLLCTVPGDIAVIAGFDQQGQQLNDSRNLAAELGRHLLRNVTVHELPKNFENLRSFFRKFQREQDAIDLAELQSFEEIDEESETDDID